MGALITSILQGAGRTGSDIQQGKDLRLDEQGKKLGLLQSQLQLQELQQKLKSMGIEQQQAGAPKFIQSYKGQDNKIHYVLQDPVSGMPFEKVGGDEALTGTDAAMADFQKVMGRPPSETEKLGILGMTPKAPPSPKYGPDKVVKDPKSPTGWSYVMANEADPSKIVTQPGAPNPYVGKEKPGDGGGGAASPLIKALADKWQKEGIKPPAKYQGQVEQYMEENNMKGKVKLNATEQMVADSVKQVTPMVDRLTKFIEDNNLQGDNDWIFGQHSSLMQHARNYGYQKGVKPEAITAELIKDAAAIQVMGARPWMTMGRSKYMYETVKQHLPSPTDTPGLLYDKLTWLRDNVLADAKASLPDPNEQQEGSQGSSQPKTAPTEQGAPPAGAVIHDFTKG